jgi:D-amino-acid dehydrogenase
MKAVIIGGGIIGLSSAYYLVNSGWDVVIIDQTDLSDSCSFGNLGMIVPSHFVPLAAPGILSQGLKWMLDNKSPFYIRPSLDPSLISWGLKFMRSATKEKVEAAAPYLRDINLYSKALYEELSGKPGFEFSLEKKGILMYYKTEKTGEEEAHLAKKASAMGLDVEVLGKDQLQQLEPGTELDVLGAVHYKCDAHLYPNQLIRNLFEYLKNKGVRILDKTMVQSFDRLKNNISAVNTTKGRMEADLFILANGSWLPQLSRLAGLQLSLMPGKGYTVTYDQPQYKLNIPAILCEARVAITPMNGKMRYGGTMEIARVNHEINMKRVEGIIGSVSKYFPSIRLSMPEKKDVWFGLRPCSPDGLPYIGRTKKLGNVMIAGGHSMMGLSLGPATGKIIADLANGNETGVRIDAFSPDRFSV